MSYTRADTFEDICNWIRNYDDDEEIDLEQFYNYVKDKVDYFSGEPQ